MASGKKSNHTKVALALTSQLIHTLASMFQAFQIKTQHNLQQILALKAKIETQNQDNSDKNNEEQEKIDQFLQEMDSEARKIEKKNIQKKLKMLRKRNNKDKDRMQIGVRRPTNPFMEFLVEQRPQFRAENLSATAKEITLKIAAKWKSLTDEQKDHYKQKFQQSQLQYSEKLKEFEGTKQNLGGQEKQGQKTPNEAQFYDQDDIDIINIQKMAQITGKLEQVFHQNEQKIVLKQQSSSSSSEQSSSQQQQQKVTTKQPQQKKQSPKIKNSIQLKKQQQSSQ